MGWRNDQCKKVCRMIDNFLANRPTERDSLIVTVRKAFDALEQAETNCSEIPNNSDTISRQAAIDALKTDMASLDHIIKGMSAYDVRLDTYVSQRNQVDSDIDTISNLPPAQPERKTGRWIPDRRGACCCSNCMEPCTSYVMMKPRDKFCKMCGSRNEVQT